MIPYVLLLSPEENDFAVIEREIPGGADIGNTVNDGNQKTWGKRKRKSKKKRSLPISYLCTAEHLQNDKKMNAIQVIIKHRTAANRSKTFLKMMLMWHLNTMINTIVMEFHRDHGSQWPPVRGKM
jgi:hypothetical protein